MKSVPSFDVLTLALFEKRINGDDALLELARHRFAQARMGAEMYAAMPEQLAELMHFRPSPEAPVLIHLPRDLNLLDEQGQKRILAFASHFAGQVYGMVLHDHETMTQRKKEYIDAASKMNEQLQGLQSPPMLFIEYAVGLEPEDFVLFFIATQPLERLNACIDIGHVGIRAARAAYARNHPGEDLCALKTQKGRLPQLMPEITATVQAGFAAVLELMDAISVTNKPVHFHLHDAHPLSTFSPFGVSDHLSFFTEIPLDFEHGGRRTVATMFGPAGLSQVVSQALKLINRTVSFTLEIHPVFERKPLEDAASIFNHWTDITNAEQMNHWLWELARNHSLLEQAIRDAAPAETIADTVKAGSGEGIINT